ncbi:MAG: DUF4956 domain-containing protein [Clostridia bacterium]|nr:DUF4956 domain-containing protein [Clostridia bacterium]MBR0406815.1 DUF4956 domain-containing protein [Clostridia bacterium]
MLENLFHGIFDSNYVTTIPVEKFLLCVGVALLIGCCAAFTASRKSRLSFSFLTTLLTLPALSCVVIMMVNGNVGVGVATAGTFSLVRFRSAAGSAKEMALIFLCMVAGLIAGMGYLAYAVLFTLILCVIYLVTNLFDPAVKGMKKRLRITVPEDLDYTGIFQNTLAAYCKDWKLAQVKTTNMGALFRLTYDITLKEPGKEKAFIDGLRLQNGNLEISIAEAETTESDL